MDGAIVMIPRLAHQEPAEKDGHSRETVSRALNILKRKKNIRTGCPRVHPHRTRCSLWHRPCRSLHRRPLMAMQSPHVNYQRGGIVFHWPWTAKFLYATEYTVGHAV